MTDEDFRDLYESLRDAVYRFAVRRVGPEAASDVVSGTFEVAWRKRADFPSDRDTWPSWLVGIAKNKVLQELQQRFRKHHDNRFLDDWPGQQRVQVYEDVALTVADSDVARRIYRELTPAEKLLFDVAFLRELSVGDAAAVLGISKSALTSRVNRLRGRLQALHELEHFGPSTPTTSGGAF